ncbi:MAG: hypothetical protein LUC88_04550 [Prevotella sp.]|nr:hypothetical protein [Prevotella sp.]
MIDNKLTIKIKQWLEQESHTEDEVREGATMLLKCNRNQAMYQTITRRPAKFESKVRYELNKILPMRLAKMTLADVKVLDEKITPVIENEISEVDNKILATANANTDRSEVPNVDDILPLRTGKRPDHDKLPDEIKKLWDENAERWKKIKELYNTCKELETPCDRYEYLTMLSENWYKYKATFETYDSYVITEETEEKTETATDLLKKINNARSYISKNVDKLIDLKNTKVSSTEEEQAKAQKSYLDLKVKIEERVKILTDNNQVIGDDLTQKLADGGISIDTDGQGNSGVGDTPAVEE